MKNAKWYVLGLLFVGWIVAGRLVSNGLTYCNDGTYSYSSGRGTCSWHHGEGIAPKNLLVDLGFLIAVGFWWHVFFYLKDHPRETKPKQESLQDPAPTITTPPKINPSPTPATPTAPTSDYVPRPYRPWPLVLFLGAAGLGNFYLAATLFEAHSFGGIVFVVCGLACVTWIVKGL